MWKALDRSDLKKVLIPDTNESTLRAKASELLGVRDCRMTEVKE
jgi:hypothetical protein